MFLIRFYRAQGSKRTIEKWMSTITETDDRPNRKPKDINAAFYRY